MPCYDSCTDDSDISCLVFWGLDGRNTVTGHKNPDIVTWQQALTKNHRTADKPASMAAIFEIALKFQQKPRLSEACQIKGRPELSANYTLPYLLIALSAFLAAAFPCASAFRNHFSASA